MRTPQARMGRRGSRFEGSRTPLLPEMRPPSVERLVPLTEAGYAAWTAANELSPEVITLCREVMTSDPVRRPASGARNVSGRYPSRKMGVTIGWESHTVELAAIYLMERDRSVLAYYEQPLRLRLDYHRADGRRVVVDYTPDFLVFLTDGPELHEWKTEEQLVRLAERQPTRYERTPEGWISRPAQTAAARLGLRFRIRSSAELNRQLVRNLALLADHLRAVPATEGSPFRRALVEHLRSHPGSSLRDLRTDPRYGGADTILPLLAHGILYFDAEHDNLADEAHVGVFLDAAQAFAWSLASPRRPEAITLANGVALEWDGLAWEVVNAGQREIVLRDEAGRFRRVPRPELESMVAEGGIVVGPEPAPTIGDEARRILEQASPSALEEANRRMARIAPYLGARVPRQTPRSIWRWIAAFRDAERRYGWGYVGLVPKPRPGNTNARTTPAVAQLMEAAIDAEFAQPHAPDVKAAYGAFRPRVPCPGVRTGQPGQLPEGDPPP